MATLNIPYSFTAGTPAVASQVNANFDAIVNWANGGISTDALGLLTARTISLPSAPLPLDTILPIYQTAAEPSIYIVNDSQGIPVTIVQDQAFGSPNKAILKISDTTTQVQSSSPTVWLDLASAATAPALLVKHGGVDTLRLTKTQLDLFAGAVQATSAGVFSATTANFTTVNTTTINLQTGNVTGNINTTGDVIYDTKYHVGPKFNDIGNQSGSYTLDLVDGSIHKISLNAAGNLALTLTNPVIGGVYVLEVYHAISNSSITWPSSIKWAGGLPPNLSLNSEKTDIISLIYNGSVYYGNVALGF